MPFEKVESPSEEQLMVVGKLKKYLNILQKRYSENLKHINLESFEITEGKFTENYNFVVEYKYKWSPFAKTDEMIKIIHSIIDDIYKFKNLISLMSLKTHSFVTFDLKSS